MRTRILSVVLCLAGPAAFAGEGIVAVLDRSQAARLEHTTAVDPAGHRAVSIRASFEATVRALGIVHPVSLRVVSDADIVAETLQGRTVVANESLAALSEGGRRFIIAHELGHIELRHWEQTENVYRKWVPGAVTPEQTDPVAALLGREASALAYRHELDADAYALRALHLLGFPAQDAVTAFMRLGISQDTATHPGTTKRLASLRAAEAAWSTRQAAAGQETTWNEPIVSVSRPD